MSRGTTAGRVHLISAITGPTVLRQISADLILSAVADGALVRSVDDSSTGNWRTVTGDCIQLVS